MASRKQTPATKSKRGAKAPRSAFRAKATRTKPKARAKTRPKAKPRTKPAARPPVATPAAASTIRLGEITVPSGKLSIFDIGLFGFLPRDALEPAIITCDVPRDRPLAVVGTRVGKGRFAECWDHVAVVLRDDEVASSKKLGEAGVDFARLACIDHTALDHWQHDESLDGLADIVFWGRDDRLAAAALRAPRTPEGYGWTNLPLADAEAKADAIARKKAENKWLLASDLRPHSHHFHALAAARANKHGAGSLELAGTRMLLWFTSWGDGVFPVYLDRDHQDRPVQVRVQLATAASSAALASINP